MAAPSLIMRILRLTIFTRPHSNSTSNSSACMITIVNYMIRMASLMSAIAGLYLLFESPFQSLLPSARSAVLVSLPHAWRSLLSWITPPCLFVILNCIIVTLTLTSGSFKGPSSANPVMKMEAVHRHIQHSPQKARRLPAVVPLAAIACKELEKEEPVTVQNDRAENYHDGDDVVDDALAMAASDHPAQTRNWHSQPRSQPASPSQKQAAKCVRRAKSIDSSSVSSHRKHANRHGFRSSSSASASYKSSASSSPSSYTLSAPSSPSSSSNPNHDYSAPTQFDPSHADDLSDEDLRNRIEAFISRMNAKMKREAATSSMEYY